MLRTSSYALTALAALSLVACASGSRRGVGDVGTGDSGRPDSSAFDSRVPDIGTSDTGTADTGASDTGTTDGSACPTGQSLCAAECVDLASDDRHCGACRAACGSGEACMTGSCASICPVGAISCGGTCVDPQTDAMFCGASAPGCTGGESCAAGESCVAGACVSPCASGETFCAGTCVDTTVDPSHCGACGVACASGETCTAGTCMAAPTTVTVTFPRAGDTRVASAGLYFWRRGDYVEGTRTTTLPSMTSVSFNLALSSNSLSCDTQDVTLSINGTDVGSFSIAGGPTSVMQSFTFPRITGPTYTFRLETTREVGSGCGSAGYTNDVTVFTLGG